MFVPPRREFNLKARTATFSDYANFLFQPFVKMRCVFVGVLSFAFSAGAIADQAQTNDYNRNVLQPLTQHRQQHRRTVDGRLCAAAFVQNRKAYTGCTDAANPSGESGRPWCYVEPQVGICLFFDMASMTNVSQLLDGSSPSWNYCGCSLTRVVLLIVFRFKFAAPGAC